MTWLPYLLAVLAVCYVTAAVLIWFQRRRHRREHFPVSFPADNPPGKNT